MCTKKECCGLNLGNTTAQCVRLRLVGCEVHGSTMSQHRVSTMVCETEIVAACEYCKHKQHIGVVHKSVTFAMAAQWYDGDCPHAHTWGERTRTEGS